MSVPITPSRPAQRPVGRPPSRDKAEALQRISDGEALEVVANDLGISARSIRRWRNEAGRRSVSSRLFSATFGWLLAACDLGDQDIERWLEGPDAPAIARSVRRWRDGLALPNAESFAWLGFAVQTARIEKSITAPLAEGPAVRQANDWRATLLEVAQTPMTLLSSAQVAGQTLEAILGGSGEPGARDVDEAMALLGRPQNQPVSQLLQRALREGVLEDDEVKRLTDALVAGLGQVASHVTRADAVDEDWLRWFVPNAMNLLSGALVFRSAADANLDELAKVVDVLIEVDVAAYLRAGAELDRVARAWLVGWATWLDRALRARITLGLSGAVMVKIATKLEAELDRIDRGTRLECQKGDAPEPDPGEARVIRAAMNANLRFIEAFSLAAPSSAYIAYEQAVQFLSRSAQSESIVATLDMRTLHWALYVLDPALRYHPRVLTTANIDTSFSDLLDFRPPGISSEECRELHEKLTSIGKSTQAYVDESRLRNKQQREGFRR